MEKDRSNLDRLANLKPYYGAHPHAIRRALCRDSRGRASGPLGAALDLLLGNES